MRSLLFRVAAISLATALFGCDLVELATPARYHEDFDYTYPLEEGARLSVENVNGSIEVDAWNKDEIHISGTKFASSKELLGLLNIDIVATKEFVQVRTVKPSYRRGSMGARYVIHVPANTVVDRLITTNGRVAVNGVGGPVRIRTSNGRVEVRDIHGEVEVRTSNGSITCEGITGDANLKTSNGAIRAVRLHGRLRAQTSNGSIKARLAPETAAEPIVLKTSNGTVNLVLETLPAADVIVTTSNASITVQAPESLRAQLRLRSTNATVTTEFDVTDAKVKSKHRLEGLVNGGGPLVQLTTSNGSVRLLKFRPKDQPEDF